jgi:lipopolysaccharide heptosyltransferase II
VKISSRATIRKSNAMSSPEVVVIVAPNWLGDAIMALPAIADLRRHFSTSRVIVAARPSVSGLFTLVPGIDSVTNAEVAAIRDAHASVAVLFPNSFASAWLVKRSGTPERWGYATDMRNILLTRAVRRPRQPLHQSGYYQHLVGALGVENGPREAALSVSENTIRDARTLLVEHGWDQTSMLVVLAPGAAYGKAKQWIPAHVVRLVTHLASERGATCALVGSRGDAATVRAIRSAAPPDCRPAILDLAGATTLPVLAGVLSLASVCVSNDSGAMHLAAAAGAPMVAIFGPTNEHATSPLARAGVSSEIVTNPVWCRPCMLRECPIDHRCMTGIDPGRVLSAIDRVGRMIA